ncbi:MAG: hypothetical protein RI907_2952 [Pseudomonadota bacterium]|jgi:twitching motility protein PilI
MANKEALRALQQRLAERLNMVRQQAPVRNFLAVEIAGHGFLLPLDQVGEIFPLSAIQDVPHCQAWFRGVANLRGQLHGVVDLAAYLGLPGRGPRRLPTETTMRDAGRLIAFNAGLQMNAALWIDRLMGLRNPQNLKAGDGTAEPGRPHFIGATWQDDQDRSWYELDLAALVADEQFLKIDV